MKEVSLGQVKVRPAVRFAAVPAIAVSKGFVHQFHALQMQLQFAGSLCSCNLYSWLGQALLGRQELTDL